MRALPVVGSVAVVLTLALAACQPANGPAVATAQQPAAAASAPGSAPATETDYDKALRYTRCMTQNGATMPDPVEGEPIPMGAAGNGWQPVATAAFEKCRGFLPDTWPIKVDPKDIGRDRRYNECMTQHGIDMSWLVPDANGMIHSPNVDPTKYYTPQWQAADAACRHLADNPATVPLSE
jgi:hypothetical protein